MFKINEQALYGSRHSPSNATNTNDNNNNNESEEERKKRENSPQHQKFKELFPQLAERQQHNAQQHSPHSSSTPSPMRHVTNHSNMQRGVNFDPRSVPGVDMTISVDQNSKRASVDDGEHSLFSGGGGGGGSTSPSRYVATGAGNIRVRSNLNKERQYNAAALSGNNNNNNNASADGEHAGAAGTPPRATAGGNDNSGGDESGLEDEHAVDSSHGSSDNTGSGTDSTGASTKDSNSRRIKQVQARPMTFYMFLLIAVPIIFLAVYQGIVAGDAMGIHQFMVDHAPPVRTMLELQKALQQELVTGSELIGMRRAYGIDGEAATIPPWAPAIINNHTQFVAQKFLETRSKMKYLLLITASGDSAIPVFQARALVLPEYLARAEIAMRRNNGVDFRKYIVTVMTELSVMFATLQQDEHATLFATELVEMQLLTRTEETIVRLIAFYREMETANNRSLTYLQSSNASTANSEQCLEFASGMSELNAFAEYLISSGEPALAAAIKRMWEVEFDPLRKIFEPFVSCKFGATTTWGNKTLMDEYFATVSDTMDKQQLHLLENIVNNAEVEHTALLAGMKLMVALICCIIGVVIVIYIQNAERDEMMRIIEHSQRLSSAVKRYVPKNQLKMMGVHSIMQVEAGTCAEVARCMVHASLRDFASLSETMSRTQLFDWLNQNYAKRMTFVVQQARGFIDRLLADSMLAVFPQATDGVYASIAMQQETDHMNVQLLGARSTQLVRINVGVTYGVVVAGVFGDQNRLTCTMVAPEVSLASRLCDASGDYGVRILCSRAVNEQLPPTHTFEIRFLGVMPASSANSEAVEVYDVYQSDGEQLKLLKNETRQSFERAAQLLLEAADGTPPGPGEKHDAKKILIEIYKRSKELRVVDPPVNRMLRKLLERTGAGAGVTRGGGGGGGLLDVGGSGQVSPASNTLQQQQQQQQQPSQQDSILNQQPLQTTSSLSHQGSSISTTSGRSGRLISEEGTPGGGVQQQQQQEEEDNHDGYRTQQQVGVSPKNQQSGGNNNNVSSSSASRNSRTAAWTNNYLAPGGRDDPGDFPDLDRNFRRRDSNNRIIGTSDADTATGPDNGRYSDGSQESAGMRITPPSPANAVDGPEEMRTQQQHHHQPLSLVQHTQRSNNHHDINNSSKKNSSSGGGPQLQSGSLNTAVGSNSASANNSINNSNIAVPPPSAVAAGASASGSANGGLPALQQRRMSSAPPGGGLDQSPMGGSGLFNSSQSGAGSFSPVSGAGGGGARRTDSSLILPHTPSSPSMQ